MWEPRGLRIVAERRIREFIERDPRSAEAIWRWADTVESATLRGSAPTRSTTNGISNRKHRREAIRPAAGEDGAARHRDGGGAPAGASSSRIPDGEGRAQYVARRRCTSRSHDEPDPGLRGDGVPAAGEVQAPRNGGIPSGAPRPETLGSLAGGWVQGPRLGDSGGEARHQQGTGEETRGILPCSGGSVSLNGGVAAGQLALRLPRPSAIIAVTSVFRLTPSCSARLVRRACTVLGTRSLNCPLATAEEPGFGMGSPNSFIVSRQHFSASRPFTIASSTVAPSDMHKGTSGNSIR